MVTETGKRFVVLEFFFTPSLKKDEFGVKQKFYQSKRNSYMKIVSTSASMKLGEDRSVPFVCSLFDFD